MVSEIAEVSQELKTLGAHVYSLAMGLQNVAPAQINNLSEAVGYLFEAAEKISQCEEAVTMLKPTSSLKHKI